MAAVERGMYGQALGGAVNLRAYLSCAAYLTFGFDTANLGDSDSSAFD